MKNIKKILLVAGVLIAGGVLVLNIAGKGKTPMNKSSRVETSLQEEDGSTVQGPHGGRLLSKEDFQLEITIYEPDIPPEFRIYPFNNGKPINPDEIELTIELHRLWRLDVIHFKREGDYLLGDKVVEEPHSFDLKVIARWSGRNYEWKYSSYEGRVELTEEAVKRAGIVIETAGPVTMSNVIRLTGEIGFNADKVVHVVPRFGGIVREVRKHQGDHVKKGDIIVILDSHELADAKAAFLAARERKGLAQAGFNREKALWEKKISSEQDYLEAKQALAEADIELQIAAQKLLALGLSHSEITELSISQKQLLTRYEIRSPIDGTVIEKRVTTGEAVKKDADIYLLADLSNVWGKITIPSKDLKSIKTGQKVFVKSEISGLKADGVLSYIDSTIDRNTQSVTGRVVIPNQERNWRPGQFVTLELVKEESKAAVAVSAGAIQTFRDWSVVFVKYGNLFEVRPLKLGRSDGQWVEVLEGLAPGEKYAGHNSFVLKAEVGKEGATHDH